MEPEQSKISLSIGGLHRKNALIPISGVPSMEPLRQHLEFQAPLSSLIRHRDASIS
jgi:hypothetical protein